MEINISRIPDGSYEYEFDEITLPEEDDLSVSEFHARVRLDKARETYLFTLAIGGTLHLVCDRCLAPADTIVDEIQTVVYRQESLGETSAADEVKQLSADQVIIDLTPDVVDGLKLAVPMKILCKEDCLGLCPDCGVNRNESACTCRNESIDPRWEQLLKFKKEN